MHALMRGFAIPRYAFFTFSFCCSAFAARLELPRASRYATRPPLLQPDPDVLAVDQLLRPGANATTRPFGRRRMHAAAYVGRLLAFGVVLCTVVTVGWP